MRAGGRPDLAEGLARRFEGKASAELAAMEETVRRSETGAAPPRERQATAGEVG